MNAIVMIMIMTVNFYSVLLWSSNHL